MLIPSIDLQGGRVVQLVQGERLAIASDDLDGWISRFRGRRSVQVIDLDAAKGTGHNTELVVRACAALPCRVGGGIRSLATAEATLAGGAEKVIVGSALFTTDGINLRFARDLARTVSPARIVAAVDSRAGHVVIHGWRTELPMSPAEAVRELEPYVSEFLYTHVDREGLMAGTDMAAIQAVAAATSRRLVAAGGITTAEEVRRLHDLGIDAVVGMALYSGRLSLEDVP